jgi:predicted Zn-dependent peptidase
MDQQTINEIVKLRAEIEVNRMVLGQFLAFVAMNQPEPQKALDDMHKELVARLEKAPQSDVANMIKQRLARFFSTMNKTIHQMAGNRGPQRFH